MIEPFVYTNHAASAMINVRRPKAHGWNSYLPCWGVTTVALPAPGIPITMFQNFTTETDFYAIRLILQNPSLTAQPVAGLFSACSSSNTDQTVPNNGKRRGLPVVSAHGRGSGPRSLFRLLRARPDRPLS